MALKPKGEKIASAFNELVEKARQIGSGNMSAGVRKALEEYKTTSAI